VVVAPNGTAGMCEYNAAEGRSFVSLDEFSSDTVADFSRWANRSPLETPDCLKCPALAICGGGCAYDSQVIMGSALEFDPWFCDTNVLVAHWMMRDLLANAQECLADRDFHPITPQERASILGRIPPEDQDPLPPGDCTDEECACRGECPAG
jgi:radical SAM protein with 4Fe4S-binding SPASM domain